MECPFCTRPDMDVVAETALAVAVRDGYPVSLGHTLIMTRRHVPDYFHCTDDEKRALWSLVETVQADLVREVAPDGFNVGFNAGLAAGQTVMHVHIHVIPRYAGDVEDPRGGVRHVVPEKANYLRVRDEILTDGENGRGLYTSIAPLLPKATRINILAAFVQDSGLKVIEQAVRDALKRGADLRIVTGDYLDITQVDALRRIADWSDENRAFESVDWGAGLQPGIFDCRVVETALFGGRAFHPKAWHLEGPDFGVAFVGSSNLSRSALVDGIEWNLRVDRHRDRAAWNRVGQSFERLWQQGRPLDRDWIASYAARVRAQPRPFPKGELIPDLPVALPVPNPFQQSALAQLAAARGEGRQRGLVVLATGLGKTLLAVHDIAAWAQDSGRVPRVLWLAHRRELLAQAAAALRQGFPDARFAWLVDGNRPGADFDFLLASIQSLSRPNSLASFEPAHFDYVVVDEVHHADAASYRRILAHFTPQFLLGLTATPERGDGGDVAGLFDDYVAFRADLAAGIESGNLVPFAYFGLADTTDYSNIPWRSGRFDPEELSVAIETQARMETLWEAWNEPGKSGSRTLVFCASVRHAEFVRNWLRDQGVRVRLCHGGNGSDDRELALLDLEAGRIDAICSVDLFNEGIDCRPVDRVVMLRPTESPVVFLQQLGRGLRTALDKTQLVVVDFVGNHRVFLNRLRTLLKAAGSGNGVAQYVHFGLDGALPSGCSIQIELAAIDFLKQLVAGSGSKSGFVSAYREWRLVYGERPTAGEMIRQGFGLDDVRKVAGSWFGWLAQENDLEPADAAVATEAADWLRDVAATQMTKCLKMVVLQVLLEQGALSDGMDLDDLASRSHDFLIRSPELFADLENVKELPDPRNPTPDKWSSYWISNPIRAWCGAGSAGGRRWFSVDGNRFVAHLPEVDPTILAELTAELVDARLVEYRRRRKGKIAVGSFLADFDWQGNEPVLRLRGDDEFAEIGNCTLEAVGPDGRAWSFPFVNGTARWVQRVGRSGNALEGLLGSDARRVAEGNRALRFTHGPDGWAFGLATTGSVEAVSWGAWDWFPVRSMDPQGTLELSAGPAGDGRVRLPGPRKPGETAVKVSEGVVGLPDVVVAGDWLVVDFPADHSNDDEFCWVLDWSGVAEGGYWNVPTTHVREPVDRVWAPGNADNLEPRTACVVRRWSPDQLAPDPGETLAMLAPWFGLHREPAGVMDWVDGHCFLCFEGTGPLERPDRYSGEGVAAAPGETAFVFARGSGDDSWTFLGIGRWKAHHCEWEFPPPPLSLWRLLSSRRSASRTLPRNWVDAAARFAEEAGVGLVGKTVQKGGAVWSVLGSTNGGGIAIERSNGGGSRRIVTATDLGWALAAENDVARFGGILSEARVNRLRYLYGTPKEATRWIDTGWAIALLRLWRSSNPSDDSIDERA